MKLLITTLGILFIAQGAWAQSIIQHRSWSGDQRFIEAIGRQGCVAETVAYDSTGESYSLQVITYPNSNGVYTNPIVIAKSSKMTSHTFYEAKGQTNKSPTYDMTLFQNPNSQAAMVASRYDSTPDVVNSLRRDSFYKVRFLDDPNSFGKQIEFSLSGSNRVIKAVLSQCI